MSKWFLLRDKNNTLPDWVREANEEVEGSIKVDDRSSIPIEVIEKWGYRVTAVRLVEEAKGDGLLWSDKRIVREAEKGPEPTEFHPVVTRAYAIGLCAEIRDSYEAERKNFIFIPEHLRGCLLSTAQKSRDFLAELIRLVEESMEKDQVRDIDNELEGWRVEMAEYDALVQAVLGERSERGIDGKEKISQSD